MSETSEEAWEEARALLRPLRGDVVAEVAAAIQRHMDATAEADRSLQIACNGLSRWKERAEKAEAARNDAREWAAHLNSRAQANLERAESAEGRVSELESKIADLWARPSGLAGRTHQHGNVAPSAGDIAPSAGDK